MAIRIRGHIASIGSAKPSRYIGAIIEQKQRVAESTGKFTGRWGQEHTHANTVIGIEKQGSSDILTELSLIGTRHKPFGQNPSATVNVRRVFKHSLNGR
jgi:hypothetical protein